MTDADKDGIVIGNMRKLVTIENILEKKIIEGADKIEAVRVRDWWVVAKKDEFKVGDLCVYFEIDSFLPILPQFEFLLNGSSKKRMIVNGEQKEGIRLKTIKLRGQLSQGLVMPIGDFADVLKVQDVWTVGIDVTERLGVILYETPMPAELVGKAKGFFPAFIPKTDEERIQNMSGILSGFYVTEKIDGTSVTYFKKDGVFGACSRNLELMESDATQWQIAKRYDLANKLPDNFAVQGELIGEGVQNNPLKQNGTDVYFFNAYNIESGRYLNYIDFVQFCQSMGIKTVPVVDDNFSLPKTVDELLVLADGKSLLNALEDREGIVIRPKVEQSYNGARLSFKVISNKYLLNEK